MYLAIHFCVLNFPFIFPTLRRFGFYVLLCCAGFVECLNVTCDNRVGTHPFRRTTACYIKRIDRRLEADEKLTFVQSYSSADKIKTVDISTEANQHGIDHLPTEVFDVFPNVEALRVNSKVKTISSSDLQGASNLTELVVSNGLEIIGIDTFPTANRLTFLSFEGNRIATIADYAFQRLSHLFSLKLQRNQLTRIKRHTFAGLSELHVLNLNQNQIQSIDDGAFQLPKLQFLQIQQNQLQTLSDNVFTGMTDLIDVSISGNRLRQINKSLYGLSNLKKIDLSFNQIADIDLNRFAAEFPALVDLRLVGSGFTFNTTLQNKRTNVNTSSSVLEYIYLDRNNLSNPVELHALHLFGELTTLSLENNLFTHFDLGDRRLKETLPKLEYLSLDGNLIDQDNINKIAQNLKSDAIYLN